MGVSFAKNEGVVVLTVICSRCREELIIDGYTDKDALFPPPKGITHQIDVKPCPVCVDIRREMR